MREVGSLMTYVVGLGKVSDHKSLHRSFETHLESTLTHFQVSATSGTSWY